MQSRQMHLAMSMKPRSKGGATGGTAGVVFMVLFALPFAGVGVFSTVLAVREFARGNWKEGAFLSLFAVVFSGVGFGLLVGTRYAARVARRKATLKATHPDAPWLWNEAWADGRVKSSTKGTMIGAWVFALFWNLVSAPAVLLVPKEVMEKGNTIALLALVFPLVGAGLFVWAIRATIRWRKFGQSVFELASVPGVIGGRLAGIVHTSVNLRPEDGFTVTLRCVQRVTTGSGKNASTTEHIRWQEEQIIGHELLEDDPTRSAIPILFTIPFDCRPTNDSDQNNRILWRLEVTGAVPGVDYQAQFEVPVFHTAQSSPEVTGGHEAIEDYLSLAERPHTARSRVRVTPFADGSTEIVFEAARNPGAAVGLTVFTAVWTAAIVLMLHFGAPVLFPVVFGLFDALMCYGVLWMWFGVTRVRIESDGITIRRSVLGLPRMTRIAAADVADITTRIGMQSGNTPYYMIVVWYGDERRATAGSGIKDKREAGAIAAAMREALGLAPAAAEPA